MTGNVKVSFHSKHFTLFRQATSVLTTSASLVGPIYCLSSILSSMDCSEVSDYDNEELIYLIDKPP